MFSQKNLLPDTTDFCMGDSAIIELKQTFEKNASTEWRAKSIGIIYYTRTMRDIAESGRGGAQMVGMVGESVLIRSVFGN